jgi:2-polyprenyl-6-methoxyphenol hydroxylase-like FAD-dependent oxidoreductase
MPSIRHVDVVIVGGGIAGSSLAASLANAGLGVVGVERERRFRDRVRGESLHPWLTMLMIDRGPEADRRRERAARAWELDPTIRAYGAGGLVADDAARRHFFGEDLAG